MSPLATFRKPLLLAGIAAIAFWWWTHGGRTAGSAGTDITGVSPPPFAVVGDSDSHSYQDRVSFPAGSPLRGGAYRDSTLQWTEVLARLRGRELDPGQWGVYGGNGLLARAYELAGGQARAPRKQDYRYNFAVSGAGCESLMGGRIRQVPRLVRLMDQAPHRWREGVVLIRIGVNSFGTADSLDRLARDPADGAVQGVIAGCIRAAKASVETIHRHHPETRIVLVGIFDNSHWTKYQDRWQSPRQLANIRQGLDAFDHALAQMAQPDPRLAFFDDRAWFAGHWGGRDAAGRPAYRSIEFGGLRVENSAGDSPDHATLADGHAGLVWNALWAQSLVDLLNAGFGMGVTPIGQDELLALLPVGPSLPPPPAGQGQDVEASR
ncbi:SGNH/GDSL hydrolase family protein [Pseudoxanthomonas wuyuanensis]|uniref:SGNH hydrolase-type esterase domain-containing protein n=1 Tax=Pseudoxanthomonas wuyuanensis TaxID=1073196 RepID=A0A286CWZ1_9GAMM|nr:SGNH/GDSL hydrolase family protein [Pseudoxanthomonas wuyuanensis]SOD50933.1 hypothetical protein SAMN06296416_101366 [Pseudoxanthomonas wuyuanensis]